MAIINLETFDIYGTGSVNTPNLYLRGYTGNVSAVSNIQAVGRTGANAFVFTNTTNADQRIVKICPNSDMIVSGVAMRVNVTPGTVSRQNYGLAISDNSVDEFKFKVMPNPDLGLTVFNESFNLGSTAPGIFSIGSFFFVELKVQVNSGGPNTGRIEVRRNNEVVLIINGVNVPSQLNRCGLGARSINASPFPNTTVIFDDWYILNETGTDNNDFLGDRRITTLVPNADALPQDWALSSGSNAWELIDELVPNDTGFIQANAAGDVSEFNKTAITFDVNSIAAVQVVARGLKTAAGANSFRLGINSAGNIENGPEFFPDVTPVYYSQIIERNPNGNIPWTRTAVDSASIVVTRET